MQNFIWLRCKSHKTNEILRAEIRVTAQEENYLPGI
jgi:hypothetical protein